MLQQGKQVILFVKGNSMYPFLNDGFDRILLRKPAKDDLTPGAITLFRYQEKYFLHRIVRKDGMFFLMHGDNCPAGVYERIPFDDILGIVKGVIRPSGRYIKENSCEYKIFSLFWSKFPRLSRSFHRVGHRCAQMIRHCDRTKGR